MSEPIKAEAALDKQAKNCGTCKHDGNQDILRTSCTGCHHWNNWTSADKPEDKPAAEWVEGELPAIGAQLECTLGIEGHKYWHKGEVALKGLTPEGVEIVVIRTGAYSLAIYESDKYLRPIKTEAQLKAEREAEEKEKELSGLFGVVMKAPMMESGYASAIAKDLYDADYRLTKGSTE